MTLYKRYLLDMTDLLSLRMTCRADACKASLSISISGRQYVPEACPYCSTPWLDKQGSDHTALLRFVDAVHVLQSRGKDAASHWQVEIAQPD